MNRSYLFIPASNAGMILSSMVLDADAIIFDLEDGVALNQKISARTLLQHSLDTLDFLDKTLYVRINNASSDFFLEDVICANHPKVHGVVLPKAEIKSLEACLKVLDPSKTILCLIESALGVIQLPQLCQMSSQVKGLLLGGEDLSADCGVERTQAGHEIDYARKSLVMHAKAFKLMAIDTPFVNIEDHQGLREEVKYVASMGYDAKVAINPRQVHVIHEALKVDPLKFKEAKMIVEAFEKQRTQGVGVFNLNGKMIDEPVYLKAKHLIEKEERRTP